MPTTPQHRSEWYWPLRIAAAGTASILVVVGYLSGLGPREPRPAGVLDVIASAHPSALPTTVPSSTTVPVLSPTRASSTATSGSEAVPARTATPKAGLQTRSAPDRAVLDWIDALGRGDVKTASALVGPKSRRYIESLGGNVEGFMTESQEGYGAWAQTPDRLATEISLGVVGGASATIVVLSGTPRREGSEGFSSEAIPAVRTSSGWVVEPTAFRSDTGGRLQVTSPVRTSDGGLARMRSTDAISASAPGAGDFYFSLDNQPAVRVAGERASGGVQAAWDPPGDMPANRHLLVVAYADGQTLTAASGVFDVG